MKVHDILPFIKQSKNIALIAHVLPDGDTIGSCIALKHALETMNKKVSMYCEGSYPDNVGFLERIGDFKRKEQSEVFFDLVIAVDCSDQDRMGECVSLFKHGKITANIDHHMSNTQYADINIVDESAAATGEIVFDLIKLLIGRLDRRIAEALYTAISTDTGSFCFSNTTSRTHHIVAELLKYGIEVDKISTLLFKNHSLEWTRLLSRALATLEMHYQNKVAVISITQEMIKEIGAKEHETSGIINFAKEIKGVELGILFKELGNKSVKVGFRSQSHIDVSKLAGRFGGGGHKKAAGCSIDKPLEEAKKFVMGEIADIFEELV